MTNLQKIGRLSLALLAMTIGGNCAHAQDAASYYKGKTVTIVVGSTPGGGYDIYARLLGRHLGKHIPGEPNVVVTNMPGAGSEIAASYVARVAPKDGTYIAAPTAAALLYPILENAAKLNYDPGRMNYLGTALSDNYLCFVRPDAPATKFADMFKIPVVMGGIANTQTGIMPTLEDNVLGTKFKVVLGYPGFRETMLAFQKGEIQGACGVGWLTVTQQYPDLYKKGEIKLVVQENVKGLPELDKLGVPLTVSYARNDEQRRILEIAYSQEEFARPYFVAAGVPADRVRMLRRAFMETMRDPALLEDAKNIKFVVRATAGKEVQALLQKIYATPPALIQKVREAVKLK